MKADIVALLVGVLVAALLAVAYFAPPYLHVPINPLNVLAVGVILTVGISLAALVRSAMTPPSYPHGGRMTTVSPLNQPPVLNLIAKFHDEDMPSVTVNMSPGDMASEVIDRHAAIFKDLDKGRPKQVILVLKAGRKDFNPVDVRKVFAALTKLKHFYHVLLLDEKGDFAAYLPVENCKKDFMGDIGESKVTDYIVEVLADPKKTGVDLAKQADMIHAVKGAIKGDTVSDELDIRDAARKMRDNEKLQALIVMRKGKPFGVLDKQSVLELSTTGA